MKKLQFIIMVACASFNIHAQSIQRNVIGTSGKTMSSSGFIIRSTVGEAIISKGSNAGYKLNQGFQQGLLLNTTLPISGLEFNAYRINPNEVRLHWKTLTETNNKGFHLERKLENENEFKTLQFLPSLSFNGNSNTTLHYQSNDENSNNGNSYYRLKQEDIDGKFNYSIVRVVDGNTASAIKLKLWPIPATDYLNISLEGNSNNEIIELIDMNGKTIKTITLSNQLQQRIDLSGLSSGIYVVKMKSDEHIMQKIIVEQN